MNAKVIIGRKRQYISLMYGSYTQLLLDFDMILHNRFFMPLVPFSYSISFDYPDNHWIIKLDHKWVLIKGQY